MARIAVVNNDTDFLTLMHDLLTEGGWDSFLCREADICAQTIKQEQPDLVILDIRMGTPEGGWTILELLTLDPATRQIPVIVCSADHRELQDKADWLRQHSILTLPKPFDLDDLYQTVSSALGGER